MHQFSASVGRKMVQYVNHLQRPNSQPERVITIILNSVMILTHKNRAFHYALREDKIMEYLDALQTSSYISSKIELIRTILTVLLPFWYLFWGTRNGTCRFSVYLLFPRNPLNVLGHIIRRWKDIFKENTTPLESWETVQNWWRYSGNQFYEFKP